MKTILVTGGAGFIGSHLSETLLKSGDKVIVIDNFNNYYNPDIKRNNIKEIIDTCIYNNIDLDNFKVFDGDIRNIGLLEEIFLNKIDCIIHLAAMAGVRESINNPKLYYDVNVTGTLNLLEKCRENNISKFIFASSSSVYGNNEKVPFSEDDFVDKPISPYAATKKSGELLCHTYHTLYGINTVCLRFFTVYGPRQRPDLAIYKFTKMIIEGKSIPFYGDGSTSRDYTYIDDIIAGIILAIKHINKNEKIFDVFNLGGDKAVTLNEIVHIIEESVNKKAKLDILPMQPGDVNKTCADISKSKEILGYLPANNIKIGIEKFTKWIYEENDKENK